MKVLLERLNCNILGLTVLKHAINIPLVICLSEAHYGVDEKKADLDILDVIMDVDCH